MQARLLIAFALFACGLPVAPGVRAQSTPLPAAVDPAALAAFDARVEAVRHQFDVPGIAVAIVKDGQVVLNIADRAVGKLQMDNDALRFSARFGGVSQSVVVPMAAVIAVYARETGQGMALPPDLQADAPGEADAPVDEAASAVQDEGGETPPEADPPPATIPPVKRPWAVVGLLLAAAAPTAGQEPVQLRGGFGRPVPTRTPTPRPTVAAWPTP